MRTIPLSDIKQQLRKAYRALDDPLFDRCLANLPGIPAGAICYFRDGDQWCCVHGDFINLQESAAGFGDTEAEAYEDLRRTFAESRTQTGGAE